MYESLARASSREEKAALPFARLARVESTQVPRVQDYSRPVEQHSRRTETARRRLTVTRNQGLQYRRIKGYRQRHTL